MTLGNYLSRNLRQLSVKPIVNVQLSFTLILIPCKIFVTTYHRFRESFSASASETR